MIENGNLFLAQPPLFRLTLGGFSECASTENQKNDIIKKGGKAILTTEDAPTNNAGSGNVDMNPTGAVMSPKMMKRKKEQGDEQEKITKKISNLVKENSDNNNIMLKQVLDSIDKVEDKLDEKNGIKKDIVIVDKKEIIYGEKLYILLNKPQGFSTNIKDEGKRVFDLLKKFKEKLFSIGELDKKSMGLLLLTNDNDLIKKLTLKSSALKNIYSVCVDKAIKESEINNS